jgi:hypothetical protein
MWIMAWKTPVAGIPASSYKCHNTNGEPDENPNNKKLFLQAPKIQWHINWFLIID